MLGKTSVVFLVNTFIGSDLGNNFEIVKTLDCKYDSLDFSKYC